MRLHRNILIILCVAIIAIVGPASAKEVKFEASLNRKALALGESAQLGFTFYGTQAIPAPDIGNIDGLEVRYVGPSTMMTVINGRVSTSITHMYTVVPLRIGKFQLGPFTFKYKQDEYTSNMVFLEVSEGAIILEEEKKPDITQTLDLQDRIFVTLGVGKTTAYVNELVPVTVKLYVNSLNVSDIQLPTFEQEGFSKIEFKEPRQYREESSHVLYEVLEFKTNIFGTRAGEYSLGPAKIKCNIMVKKRLSRGSPMRDDFFGDEFYKDSFFDDFFTRYERYPIELKSQDSRIIVSPLPSENRPSDFSGAVGDYQFIYNVSPKKVKVGDPVTVTMEINGTGNFNTVLVPKLDSTTGFKVYEPEIKTDANKKAFVQVLIPETDKVTQIPRASFNFFDVNKKRYIRIDQGPLPIEVEKGKEESPAQVIGPVAVPPSVGREREKEEDLVRDIIYIKESPGVLVRKGHRIYKNRISLILLILVPLILLITFYIIDERRNRLRVDTVYASRLAAIKAAKDGIRETRHYLKSKDATPFYDALFGTLQDYLGNRLRMSPAGVTYDAVAERVASKDVDLDIMRKTKHLFEVCDELKFSKMQGEIDESRMIDDSKELEEVIRYFERVKI